MKSSHPLKGRKWTPEQRAKAAATRLRNKGLLATGQPVPIPPEQRIKEALSFLVHSKSVQDRGYSRTLIDLAIHTLRGTT